MTKPLRWTASMLIVLVVALAWTPWDQRTAIAESESGLKSALLMHAVARGLGAALAVAQGTRVGVEPLGMGVELAPGEILKPLHELVEQFAAAMLAAAMLFGVQLLLIKLGGHWSLCLAITAVATGVLFWWWTRGKVSRLPLNLLVLLLMVRFAIPVSTSLSGWFDTQVLQGESRPWTESLQGSPKVDSNLPVPQPDLDSLKSDDWGVFSITSLKKFMSKLWESIAQKSSNAKETADRLARDVDKQAEAMVRVAVAYLVRAIVLPLLFGIIFVALIRSVGSSLIASTSGRSPT